MLVFCVADCGTDPSGPGGGGKLWATTSGPLVAPQPGQGALTHPTPLPCRNSGTARAPALRKRARRPIAVWADLALLSELVPAVIDGDAGTDWCPSDWTGSLVVDLGQVRSLTNLGLTLDATSPSADATIQVASTAGDWKAVPAAKNIALDPGNPMYVPLPRGTQARYAQLTVYSGTGCGCGW